MFFSPTAIFRMDVEWQDFYGQKDKLILWMGYTKVDTRLREFEEEYYET